MSIIELQENNKESETEDSKKPTLIIIRGVPGSGKSYLATALEESLGKEMVEIIDPDTINRSGKEFIEFSQKLLDNQIDIKFHPYRFLMEQANKAISKQKIIIWDQPFTDLEGFEITVEKLQAIAAKNKFHLKILVVEIEIDQKVAMERIIKRKVDGGHGPTPTTFEKFTSQYISFKGKGYNTITINGQDELYLSVKTVKDTIYQCQ